MCERRIRESILLKAYPEGPRSAYAWGGGGGGGGDKSGIIGTGALAMMMNMWVKPISGLATFSQYNLFLGPQTTGPSKFTICAFCYMRIFQNLL